MRKISSKVVKLATFLLSVIVVSTLCFPASAFAQVSVDGTDLAQGTNSVGGGTAELSDSSLSMNGVSASSVYTDESLDISLTGGNDIDTFTVGGDAESSMSMTSEDSVGTVGVEDSASLDIKMDGHDAIGTVSASDDSSVTLEVYGENELDNITATDDASITIKGKTCQKKDELEVGEGLEDAGITAENGDVVIDHVTIEMESEKAHIGSKNGRLSIDTSKIEGDDEDNKWTEIISGKEMMISESVIEITGTVYAKGEMTIKHSDLEIEKPDSKYDNRPYRVFSETGIELIDEENGEVCEGEYNDTKVWYVDTDDNEGSEVDLEADGEPEYYNCGKDTDDEMSVFPQTGDNTPFGILLTIAFMAAAAMFITSMRRNQYLYGTSANIGFTNQPKQLLDEDAGLRKTDITDTPRLFPPDTLTNYLRYLRHRR